VQTQAVLNEALTAAFRAGHHPEALLTVASAPWTEIERVARAHGCEGLLLGVAPTATRATAERFEALLAAVDCDVAFLLAPEGWIPEQVERILLPVGGSGGHFELRSRLLGALARTHRVQATWMTVQPPSATPAQVAEARRTLERLAHDRPHGEAQAELVQSDDPAGAILERAAACDLLIVGLARDRTGRRAFGDFALRFAREAPCATLFISRGE